MTNREWLMEQMQNMSDEDLGKVFLVKDKIIGCDKIRDAGECENVMCRDCQTKWLKAEHKEKPKLSEAERVILENMSKDYEWIGRFKCGRLFLFNNMEKPYRDDKDEYWHGYGVELDFYDHLFQFIKWEDTEAYEISELLKGE